jgi:hypothetical protein
MTEIGAKTHPRTTSAATRIRRHLGTERETAGIPDSAGVAAPSATRTYIETHRQTRRKVHGSAE